MAKTRIVREFIITVGFLPGLWLYIGVNPEAQVSYAVIDVIAQFISQIVLASESTISGWGRLFHDLAGIVSAIFSWIFTYLIGGAWGILAVLTAFAGGLFIESIGIWLLIAALVIAPFLPVDEEHTL